MLLFLIHLGFIDRLFGKKKEVPVPAGVSLTFDKVPAWLETESRGLFSELHPQILHKYGEMQEAIDALRESRACLDDATIVVDAPKRLAKAGDSNKGNLLRNLDIMFEKIVVPEDSSISGAYRFHQEALSVMGTSIENTARSQQYIKALFPAEYDDVMGNLSKLSALFDELQKLLGDVKGKLDLYEGLPETIASIGKILEDMRGKRKVIQDYGNICDQLETDLADQRSRLDDVLSSKEFAEAQQLEDYMGSLEKDLSVIDSAIRAQFTPLSKAFSRMQKQDESGRYRMPAASSSVLNALLDDPSSATGHDINAFLLEVKGRVAGGTLGLKDKKKGKTLEHIDKLLDSGDLVSQRGQRGACLSEIEQVSQQLQKLAIYDEKTTMERSISHCWEMLGSRKQEMGSEKDILSDLAEEHDRAVADLASDLSNVFDRDVRIAG